MRFKSQDGVVLSGDDFRDIVRSLRRSSLEKEKTEAEYMAAVARRVGGGVRTDRHADFVADLVSLGYLIKVEREK